MLEKHENGGRLRDYVLTLVNEPLPTQFPRLPEHKNADFVLEKPENGGFRGQKRTKMPILCSGRKENGIEREEIGIRKHNRSLPANHRARFQNANAS